VCSAALALASGPSTRPEVRDVRLAADRKPKARLQVTVLLTFHVIKQCRTARSELTGWRCCLSCRGNGTRVRDRRRWIRHSSHTWSGYLGRQSRFTTSSMHRDGINGGLGFHVLRLLRPQGVLEDCAQHGIDPSIMKRVSLNSLTSVACGACSSPDCRRGLREGVAIRVLAPDPFQSAPRLSRGQRGHG